MRLIWTIIFAMVLYSCTKNDNQSTPLQSNQEANQPTGQNQSAPQNVWAESLSDSITLFSSEYEEITLEKEKLYANLDQLLTHFELVNDPIYVEPYRVVSGWKEYDTFTRQGILGRVLEDGTIEIIVTAQGDFNSITFSSSSGSVTSEKVASGNALHTQTDGLTRVAFNNASQLAGFVATHINEPITLQTSAGKTFTLSGAQKQMLSYIFQFAQASEEISKLEQNENRLYNKIQLCELKLEELKNK